MLTAPRLILAWLLFAACTSCATVTKLANETRDCAQPKIADRLPAVLPVVLAVLDTASPTVHDTAMKALEAGLEGGRDTLVCALDSILGELDAVHAPAGKPSPGATMKATPPTQLEARAHAYLKAHAFQHANASAPN